MADERKCPAISITFSPTSRVARKQGLAGRLLAAALASEAADGALVSGLGIFDQGFYNQLGFGSGSYEHWLSFDPADLQVGTRAHIPRRITVDDWAMAPAARLARHRSHGSCNLFPPAVLRPRR